MSKSLPQKKSPQETALVKLSQIERLLEEASTLSEIKQVVNMGEAARQCAKLAKMSTADCNKYAALKLRAQRKAGKMLEGLEKSKGGRPENSDQAGRSLSAYSSLLIEETIPPTTARRWQTIARIDPKFFDARIDEILSDDMVSELTTAWLLAEWKKSSRQDEIQEQWDEIKSSPPPDPKGTFGVISLDPPWPYGTEYDPEGRRAANPYPEMSLEQIAALELPADDDCILWLWTTHKFMRHSFALLDGWGFRDVAILTWEKSRMGLGSWLRSQTEFCIMAVRGSPKIDLTNQTTILHGELREHSRKPDEFYAMVESLCLSGSRLDFFAREARPGWCAFGNDTERFSQ